MELVGFVVGDDLYGHPKRIDIKKKVDHVPSINEIEVPGITEIKLISLDVKDKRKIIEEINWSMMGSWDDEHIYSLV